MSDPIAEESRGLAQSGWPFANAPDVSAKCLIVEIGAPRANVRLSGVLSFTDRFCLLFGLINVHRLVIKI